MISIIVCSVSPDKLKMFKENIASTIGISYEIIAIDNRKDNFPITKAYNTGAVQAKYPYLCFAHEDIAFYTNNWGESIISKLADPYTGVIGFAGSSIKTGTISTWLSARKYTNINLICTRKGIAKKNIIRCGKEITTKQNGFEQVITLDGLCMFSRKNVWEKYKFDDINFDGFHLYDVDFSFAVSRNLRNFVCFGINIEHFSNGSYNNEWLRYARVFHKKWEESLPASVKEIPRKEWQKLELYTHKSILYLILKRRLIPKEYVTELKNDFLKKNKNFIDAIYIKYMYGKYKKSVK